MPAERIREHAVPVAAARRRRLRADQARQLADLLRHQIRTSVLPGGVLPLEGTIGADYRVWRNTVRQAVTGRGVLAPPTALTGDPDPLVRAAAYEALGTAGCPPDQAATARAALADPAWQVRAGVAKALGAAAPADAVPALAETLGDPNADVRKAAVLALLRHPSAPAARTAPTSAATDTDADVRAYAGRVNTG